MRTDTIKNLVNEIESLENSRMYMMGKIKMIKDSDYLITLNWDIVEDLEHAVVINEAAQIAFFKAINAVCEVYIAEEVVGEV